MEGLDPATILDAGAFALVAFLVIRWFGRLEGALDRLSDTMRAHSETQHAVVRVLSLLALAMRSEQPNRDALTEQALEMLERRKETRE